MTNKKKEEWEDIKSTNGENAVRNFGRVRSNERTIMRSNGQNSHTNTFFYNKYTCVFCPFTSSTPNFFDWQSE